MSMLGLSRRGFLKGLWAAVGGAVLLPLRDGSIGLAGHGRCPQLEGRKVRWIVPAAPGGGFDTYSRLIKPFYEERIGAEIVIENVPGAGTIVGSKILKESNPNGLTLGILDAPGLLIASLTGETAAPNPAKDFTILGRVVRSQMVWAAGGNSPFQTVDDILVEAQKRPILFGATGVGGTFSVNIAVTSFLLGIDHEFIAGYPKGRAAQLAAVRGEIDLVAFTFESILNLIEAGDLRPMLQVSVKRISPHPSLEGVPLLGGDVGLAATRAAELGRDVEKAKADAMGLARLLGGGRLVAAPVGLNEDLFRCLEQGLHEALTDPAFKAASAAAKRSLDVARADVARADIQTASEAAKKFIPIVRRSIKKAGE